MPRADITFWIIALALVALGGNAFVLAALDALPRAAAVEAGR